MFPSEHRAIHQSHLTHIKLTIKNQVEEWIRKYLIDDDPYDQEAWNDALLQTQKALHIEQFPKEFY